MNEIDKMEMIEHAEALHDMCLEYKCDECPFGHKNWKECILFSEPHAYDLEFVKEQMSDIEY